MNVLHLQLSGGFGGISILTKDINKISNHKNFFYFVFEGGSVAEKIEKDGGIVYVANEPHNKILRGAKHFVKYLKDNNIDVVLDHSGSPFTRFYHIYAKRRMKSIRFYLYLHSTHKMLPLKYAGIKGRIYDLLIKSATKKSEKVIAISNFVKDAFVDSYHIDEKKVAVVYNGCNIKKYYRSNNRSDKFVITYVGRLIKVKGVHILLKAVSKLENKNDYQVNIVGEGPELNNLIALSKKLNIDNIVTFHGAKSSVEDYLSTADVFVHPAICEEGFGITLIEAMSAGVPCIAFNKGAIPEIIENGKNGFIIPVTNADFLTKQLKDCQKLFLTDKYKELIKGAKKTANKFSIEKTVFDLERLY